MTPPPPPPSGPPEQSKEAQLNVLLEAGLINEDSLNEDHTRSATTASASGSSDPPPAASDPHTNKDKETLHVLLEVGLINEDSLNDDRTRTGTNASGEGCENLRSPGVPTEHEESSSRAGKIADHDDAVVALGGTSKTTALGEEDLKKEDIIISEGLTYPSPPTTATTTATSTSTTSGGEETTATRSTTTTTMSSCSVLRETPGAFAINRQAVQRLEPMGSVRSLNVSIAANEEAEDVHSSSSSEELSLPPEEEVLLEDAFVVAEEGRLDNDCHLNSAFHDSSGQFTTATDTASAELELIAGHVITTTNTNKGTSTKETQDKHFKATRWILAGLAAIIVIVVVLWATLFRNGDGDERDSIGAVTTEVAPAILEDHQGAANLGIIPPFLAEKDGMPSPIAKAIATIDSPQYHANIWMRNDPHLNTYSIDRQWQRFHMVSFYFMSNGNDWHRNDHWLSYNVSECQWFNHGTSAGVYGLDSLEALDVCTSDTNELLVFNLSSNNLHGHFELITHWVPTMRRFDISNNQLEGLLPVMSHQPHVEVYDVSNNQFDGLMVGEFSSFGMKVTRTHGNRLFGHAPGIYQFLQHLEHLDNSNNLYQNPLVSEIGHCQHLKALNNANNMFYGSLPSELGSLSLLTTYNVSNNAAVNGTIPSEYGLLTKLTTLDLSGTSVMGRIPDPLCERSRNGSLDIWANCNMVECCSSTLV